MKKPARVDKKGGFGGLEGKKWLKNDEILLIFCLAGIGSRFHKIHFFIGFFITFGKSIFN
jgi:hypothetical protein